MEPLYSFVPAGLAVASVHAVALDEDFDGSAPSALHRSSVGIVAARNTAPVPGAASFNSQARDARGGASGYLRKYNNGLADPDRWARVSM